MFESLHAQLEPNSHPRRKGRSRVAHEGGGHGKSRKESGDFLTVSYSKAIDDSQQKATV